MNTPPATAEAVLEPLQARRRPPPWPILIGLAQLVMLALIAALIVLRTDPDAIPYVDLDTTEGRLGRLIEEQEAANRRLQAIEMELCLLRAGDDTLPRLACDPPR
jgi:hypothetical protein